MKYSPASPNFLSIRASAPTASSFCWITVPLASVRVNTASSGEPKRLASTSMTNDWSFSTLNLNWSTSFSLPIRPLISTGGFTGLALLLVLFGSVSLTSVSSPTSNSTGFE